MTRNEKIAEVMGWDDSSHEYNILQTWDEQLEGNKWCIVKDLQSRMVEDGWYIQIMSGNGTQYIANAILNPCDYNSIESGWQLDEPSAIVELFCKVYGITE